MRFRFVPVLISTAISVFLVAFVSNQAQAECRPDVDGLMDSGQRFRDSAEGCGTQTSGPRAPSRPQAAPEPSICNIASRREYRVVSSSGEYTFGVALRVLEVPEGEFKDRLPAVGDVLWSYKHRLLAEKFCS